MSTLETLALQNIYGRPRTNPHETRLKAVSGMMPSSGLAKPLLAMVAGRELSAAGEWDDQQEAAALESQKGAMQMLQEKTAMEAKQKNVDAYIKIAQVDPVAANAVNEKLGLFPGINLTGKLTKEGFVDIDFAKDNAQGIPEGHYKVNVNDLIAAGQETDPAKKQEIISKRFFKINPPADKFHPTPDQRSFEAFTNKYYLDNGIDPAKATAEQKNAAELFAQKQMEGSKVKVAGAGRSDNSTTLMVTKDAEGNPAVLHGNKKTGNVKNVTPHGLGDDGATNKTPQFSPDTLNRLKELSKSGMGLPMKDGSVWAWDANKNTPYKVK